MSTPPPLEDVLKGKCLDPFSLEQFATYLESFHCVENLEFILGIKKIIQHQQKREVGEEGEDEEASKYDGLPSPIQRLWDTLYKDFLLETSHKEVNLPHSTRAELLKFKPESLQLPPKQLVLQSSKIVYELLTDSYSEFIKFISPHGNRRTSEAVPPHLNINCIELPMLPESFVEMDFNSNSAVHSIDRQTASSVLKNSPILFKPIPRPSFSHFQLEKPDHGRPVILGDHSGNESNGSAVMYYTLPSALPSPKPLNRRRASEPHDKQQDRSIKDIKDEQSTQSKSASRSNSTSSSSRGSSIGSIVETLKGVDNISWRKAVKKFRIRRFLHENLEEVDNA